MKTLYSAALFFFIACAGLKSLCAEVSSRDRLLMDFGWRFYLGDDWGIAQNLGKAGTGFGPASVTFSDASWRNVDLPHDWAIELPFDQKADGSHGFRALGAGFPQNSVGWYRRRFDMPKADAGRRIWLEFDGVFRDSQVFVNGWYVGGEPSGYSSFRFDVTDVVNPGETNVVAVRVNASNAEGWFYEGAGIYRHVWLVKTAPVAIEPDGVFVMSHVTNSGSGLAAEVITETEVHNFTPRSADAEITWEIFDASGTSVGRSTSTLVVGSAQTTDRQSARQVRARRRSPSQPYGHPKRRGCTG